MFDASSLRRSDVRARHGLTVSRLPLPESSAGLLAASIDELWDELHGCGPLIVQVRHRYARLIARRELPMLAERDEAAGLCCRPDLFAYPVLRRCSCPRCVCLPSLRIHDETAGECLQVCAPPGFSAARWERLNRFFEPVNLDSLGLDESGGNRLRRLPTGPLARLPGNALFAFFGRLLRAGEAARATLRTPAATLTHDILPQRFFVEQNVLTLGDDHSTLQVALPGLHGVMLHVGDEGGAARLHLAGPDGTSLLTLAPAGGRVGGLLWRDWLAELAE
jgi:hypothetical protein